jgi:hypothetical protein
MMTNLKPNPSIYLGLVHGPVRDKAGSEVTTSVTNLDIHDIARACRTFGFTRYFIITPLQIQHELVNNILGHWETDKGTLYNPDRSDALSHVQLLSTVANAAREVERREGKKPIITATGANISPDGDEKALIQRARLDASPILLLFGTGWGFTASFVESCDFRLGPIKSHAPDGYNHLSVRSAVAIYCDRLARSL